MIIPYNTINPNTEKNVFIAQNAVVIGNVKLSENSSVWFNAVVRGDIEEISIGKGTNIQDNSTLHTSAGYPLSIGEYVTVGHNAVLHGCSIRNNCLIGMGAIVLDGAIIGENSLIAAGSIVTPNKNIPPRSLVMGSPAKVIRQLTEAEIISIRNNADSYIELKSKY